MNLTLLILPSLVLGQVSSSQPVPAIPQPFPAVAPVAPVLGEPTPAMPRPSRATPVPTPAATRPAAPATPLVGPGDPSAENQPRQLVRPAVASEPLVPVRQSGPVAPARGLLNQALATPQTEAALAGQPLALLEALARVIDRRQQRRVIEAYWMLSIRVARCHFALDERDRLLDLDPPQPAHQQAMLKAAQAAAQATFSEARSAAVAAEIELADAAGLPIEQGYVPTDAPFVSVYQTNFETLFAGRVPPRAIRQIDRTLPLQRDLINARASATAAAAAALRATRRAYADGEVALAAVLAAQATLRDQRRQFLAAVHQYNSDIAHYALTVIGPGVPRETIVSTLIETLPTTDSVLVPKRGAQPASAIEPIGEKRDGAQLTPAKDGTDLPLRPVPPSGVPGRKPGEGRTPAEGRGSEVPSAPQKDGETSVLGKWRTSTSAR